MKKYLETLRKCPLFNEISDEDVLRMLKCMDAKVISFDKKYTIFSEGSPAMHFGIMLSGSAHVVQVDYYGNRTIIDSIGKSEMFGDAFACTETRTLPVSVIAQEPCEVMLIECAHILHTCSNNCTFHRRLIFNIMKNLAAKSISLHQKLEITSKRTTREKLLSYLSFQAKRAKSSTFEISFDRQELADYLEVDRSGLSTEIGKLKKEGIIENEKKSFTML